MATESSLPTVIKGQGQSEFPAESLCKTGKLRLQKLPFPNGVYPLSFQNNPNLSDLKSKLNFQNFDSP
jgi:hypothetical protein